MKSSFFPAALAAIFSTVTLANPVANPDVSLKPFDVEIDLSALDLVDIPLLAAEWVYSDNACKNAIAKIEGTDSGGPGTGVWNLNNAYIGSVGWFYSGVWVDSFYVNKQFVAYDGCCPPSHLHPPPFYNGYGRGSCFPVTQNVATFTATFQVCDCLGGDNQY
jgi:hypothetical protein